MDFKTDIVEKSDARLISQYAEAVNIKAILEACSIHSQELEDTAKDLFEKRWLDVAVGDQLTRYGEILNVPREGETDDEVYRILIKAQIIRYSSSGQYSNLIRALKMLGNLDTVHIQELYPASITIQGTNEDGDIVGNTDKIRDTINFSKAAGVAIQSVALSKSPPFAFAEYPLESAGFDEGWLSFEREDLVLRPAFAFAGASGFVAGFTLGDYVDPLEGGVLKFS